jgi:hypothetical protein
VIISLRGVEKKSFLPRRDRGYFMRAEDIWRTLLNARRKLLAPCHSRAVNTEAELAAIDAICRKLTT